jgi:hypothetical protein
MENDWRHSQCSKVELNLRVTLVSVRACGPRKLMKISQR